MRYANASELYRGMVQAITDAHSVREVGDSRSPAAQLLAEASLAQTFVLTAQQFNNVDCRSVDMRWAVAYVLHFFAGIEEAGILRRYNKLADKFLTGDRLIGAYGAIAMPQIRWAIDELRTYPQSRRAVVTMGTAEYKDINRPACITAMHFLATKRGLDTIVYQRSLNLSVMPYDCILLTNISHYVAAEVGQPLGNLHWVVGSLHGDVQLAKSTTQRLSGLLLPKPMLEDAYVQLHRPTDYPPYTDWLQQDGEVRT